MIEKPCYVYSLKNPINQYPFYIGITNNVDIRFFQHLNDQVGKKRASIITHIEKSGFMPVMVVLEKHRTKRLAKRAELFWIELYRSRNIPIVNKEVPSSMESVDFHLDADKNHMPSNRRKSPIKSKPTNPTPISTPAEQSPGGKKPNNHGKPWNFETKQELKSLFMDGLRLPEIANTLGRTQYSILKNLERMAENDDQLYLLMLRRNILTKENP